MADQNQIQMDYEAMDKCAQSFDASTGLYKRIIGQLHVCQETLLECLKGNAGKAAQDSTNQLIQLLQQLETRSDEMSRGIRKSADLFRSGADPSSAQLFGNSRKVGLSQIDNSASKVKKNSNQTALEKYSFTFKYESQHPKSLKPYAFTADRPLAGVTIGAGYDLGSKKLKQFYKDMEDAGLSHITERLSTAVGLRDQEARNWVAKNTKGTGAWITEDEEKKLFNVTASRYESGARKIVDNAYGAGKWDSLSDGQRQMLFDRHYHGGLPKWPKLMNAVVTNNWESAAKEYLVKNAVDKNGNPNDRMKDYYNQFIRPNLP